MAIALNSKPNTSAPTVDEPYGNIRDRDGAIPGTPVTKEVYADFHQFFSRMMELAEVNYNDLPDNNANGFQLINAFMRLATTKTLSNIYRISQSGTADPVISAHDATLIGITSITPNRVSVGKYTITTLGGFFGLATAPDGLMLIPSSGDANSPADSKIDMRFENGIIAIETYVGGVLTDSVLTNFCFEIRFLSDNLY